MELSQEHFDNQILELNKRLDNMATKAELESIRINMVTKADLISATENQTKELENYTDSVASSIIEAFDSGFDKVRQNLGERDKRIEIVEQDIQKIKGMIQLS